MDLGIAGKVAMVAAASKGIGRACAEALAAEGCRVSICSRTPTDVPGVELAVAADVSSADDLVRWHAETAARLGAVDILVTNTGGPKYGRFATLGDDHWAASVESTLMNVVRTTRLVIPSMR